MRYPWVRRDYCPLNLRDPEKVLADAVPAERDGLYGWFCAGGDWWSVYPPDGVIPVEYVVMLSCPDRPGQGSLANGWGWATPGEARAALEAAVARLGVGAV